MGDILKAPENMLHPRDYVAPSSNSTQTRGATGGINTLTEDQIFNNSSQGSGIAGPSVWGGPSDEKGSQSSAEAGTKVANPNSVDLVSGQNSCWMGGAATKG